MRTVRASIRPKFDSSRDLRQLFRQPLGGTYFGPATKRKIHKSRLQTDSLFGQQGVKIKPSGVHRDFSVG